MMIRYLATSYVDDIILGIIRRRASLTYKITCLLHKL